MEIEIFEYDDIITINEKDVVTICGDDTKEELSKQLLLKTLTDKGIKYDGVLINHKSPKEKIKSIQNKIGFVFKDPRDYLTNITCYQEIEFNLKYLNIPNRRTIIKDIIDKLGINPDILKKKSLEISLCDQKKIMLASILVIDPKVIVLHNIEIGLMEKDKIEIRRLLKEINYKYGVTIVLITNDESFYLDISKRVIVLENNKIAFDEPINLIDKIDSEYIIKSPLRDFMEKANKKKAKLAFVTSKSDLLKNIYRSINNQV